MKSERGTGTRTLTHMCNLRYDTSKLTYETDRLTGDEPRGCSGGCGSGVWGEQTQTRIRRRRRKPDNQRLRRTRSDDHHGKEEGKKA